MDAITILNQVLDKLWTAYKQRVSYAATYNKLVLEHGGQMTNDHMAFRTLNTPQGQPSGINAISRIIIPLGYYKAGEYVFKEKMLYAEHFLHVDPKQPKIFISQLQVDQLPDNCQQLMKEAVSGSQDPLSDHTLQQLKILEATETLKDNEAEIVINDICNALSRPWEPPLRSTVETINTVSQYGAWTLLHGNSVNHFTAYINEQQVPEWKDDLEVTMQALKEAGVPIKSAIEGGRGTKLRQSSTEAVHELCPVREADNSLGEIDWTYAYYELLERHEVEDEQGKKQLFTGFLGDQATNLFDMTQRNAS